jgi:hypothetical protein
MAKNVQTGGQVAVGTINIVPGYSLTLLQGLNGPVVITNGHGININLQGHMDPCTITSFNDHFDIVQLGGDQVADMDTF